jgi:hypothetical protein
MRFALRLGLPLTAYLDLDPKFLKPPKPEQNMIKGRQGGKASDEPTSKLDPNCLRVTSTTQALNSYFDGKDTLIRVSHAIVNIADKASRVTDSSQAPSPSTTASEVSSSTKFTAIKPKKSCSIHANHAAKALGPVKFLAKLLDWLVYS